MFSRLYIYRVVCNDPLDMGRFGPVFREGYKLIGDSPSNKILLASLMLDKVADHINSYGPDVTDLMEHSEWLYLLADPVWSLFEENVPDRTVSPRNRFYKAIWNEMGILDKFRITDLGLYGDGYLRLASVACAVLRDAVRQMRAYKPWTGGYMKDWYMSDPHKGLTNRLCSLLMRITRKVQHLGREKEHHEMGYIDTWTCGGNLDDRAGVCPNCPSWERYLKPERCAVCGHALFPWEKGWADRINGYPDRMNYYVGSLGPLCRTCASKFDECADRVRKAHGEELVERARTSIDSEDDTEGE